MRRKTTAGTFFFFLSYIIAITLMNAFLAWRINALYNAPFITTFSPLTFLTLLYPLLLTVDQERSTKASRTAYLIDTTLLGLIFFLAAASVLEFLASILWPTLIPYSHLILILLFLLIVAAAFYQAFVIRVRRFTLPIKGLTKNLRLVQASDLHLGAILQKPFAERVVKTINAQEPDLVLITGDLLDSTGGPTHDLLKPFALLAAPAYAVLGNHDLFYGDKKAQALMEGTGITVLRNRSVVVDGLRLAGADCPMEAHWKDPNPTFKEIIPKDETPTVLLYHMPSSLKDAKDQGVSLMLCGHTHFGQIFPMHFFMRVFYRYIGGKHKLGPMTLYVSHGVGSGGPPFRLFSRSEIVVFDLVPV